MPKVKVNGVELFCEKTGNSGEPLVLVHGSWVNHHNWDRVVPLLALSYQVITYDRRGHSQSERPSGAGSIQQDTADLAALIETLQIAPAHIVGHSFGGSIVLRLCAERPDQLRSTIVHEPPLLGLLANDRQGQEILKSIQPRIQAVIERLEFGDMEGGVQLFVETIAFGPGEWALVPAEFKQMVIHNAPTFLDEMHDPKALSIDIDQLSSFPHPMLFTYGEHSPAFLQRIVEILAKALPQAQRKMFAGAGHEPEDGHPEEYVNMLLGFLAEKPISNNSVSREPDTTDLSKEQ
jgi:pimeloyl-ACP methyl ester carboxylesterase